MYKHLDTHSTWSYITYCIGDNILWLKIKGYHLEISDFILPVDDYVHFLLNFDPVPSNTPIKFDASVHYNGIDFSNIYYSHAATQKLQ